MMGRYYCIGRWLLLLSGGFLLNTGLLFAQQPQLGFYDPPPAAPLNQIRINTIRQTDPGFIWMGTRDGLIRFDGYDYYSYFHHPRDTQSISCNWITGIITDPDGQLWISTDGGGLNKFDPFSGRFQSFRHHPEKSNSISNDRISSIARGANRTLWLSTPTGELDHFDLASGQSTRYDLRTLDSDSAPLVIQVILPDSLTNTVWLGTQTGLKQLEREKGTITSFRYESGAISPLSRMSVTHLLIDTRRRMWIGTQNGLYRYIPGQNKVSLLRYREGELNSLAHNEVNYILEDRQQRIWIATTNGISLWNEERANFDNYSVLPERSATFQTGSIHEIFEDEKGHLWLSFSEGGYSLLAPFRKKIRSVDLPGDQVGSGFLRVQEATSGKLWIATLFGFYRFEPASGTFLDYRPAGLGQANWSLEDLVRLPGDYLLLKTSQGYFHFDPESENFTSKVWEDHPPPAEITKIVSDHKGQLYGWSEARPQLFWQSRDGNWQLIINDLGGPVKAWAFDAQNQLWLGTEGAGLLKWSPEEANLKRFFHQENDPASLRSNFITAIKVDQSGQLWIGSRGGLHRLVKNSQGGVKFDHWYRSNSTLTIDIIQDIQLDKYDNLWLITTNGIFQFKPRENKFIHYGIQDGFSSYDFLPGEQLGGSGAWILMGTRQQLNYFHVDSLRRNAIPPKVLITDFRLFGQSVPLYGSLGDSLSSVSPLVQPVYAMDTLLLKWWQNDIGFSFAALTYSFAEKNNYLYRLEGHQDNWLTSTADQRWAFYNNLRPGTYAFLVQASNYDGRWTDTPTRLVLIIQKPWWTTWWAFTVYGLLALLFFYGHVNLLARRRLAQYKASRLKELDEAKTRLYTNLSHEFRTPITLINGMAEQIKKKPEAWLNQGLSLIQRNARQLLNMVNQMLELRKLETGMMSVHYRQGDVVAFLNQCVEPFIWQAKLKNTALRLVSEEPSILMDFDPEKLLRIISNLLSNAIKFTPKDGEIYVLISRLDNGSDSQLKLSVKDSGIGIPAAKLPKVFDRFFQGADATVSSGSNGTGIGLALIDELVKRLDGTIQVKSEEGKGTTFTVLLPVKNEAPTYGPRAQADFLSVLPDAIPLSNHSSPLPNILSETDGHPIALLIDDNPDVLTYLWTCLQKDYIIKTAKDGDAGIEAAIAILPDIIISDIMMPGTDGLELCGVLKADERTSHIPIILLTARADQASRLAGWETGADSYLTKPFHPEELRIRMRNLLAIRAQIRQHYPFPPEESAERNERPWKEDPFVRKTQAFIESQLDNFDLKVEDLCKAMHLSHSQLHRKLTAVCGLSPNRFIRHIRLLHAKDLLADSERTVTAVAFDTGFQDPDYFSKVFKEAFGQTPSEFRQHQNA